MIVKAEQAGIFPAGCHWTKGEQREIVLEKGQALPSWLIEIKQKAKAKPKKAEPKSDEG